MLLQLMVHKLLWLFYISESLPQIESTSDMLIIRHGRSRVRHSSEKDHIRWGLKAFDNLTLDSDYDNNDTLNGNQSFYGNGSDILYPNGSAERVYLVTTVDYPLKKSHENDGANNSATTAGNVVKPISFPATTKKKLAKKEIMANIRKTVDKGVEYLKSHAHLNDPNVEIDLNVPPTGNPITNNNRDAFHGVIDNVDIVSTLTMPARLASDMDSHHTNTPKPSLSAKDNSSSSNRRQNSTAENQFKWNNIHKFPSQKTNNSNDAPFPPPPSSSSKGFDFDLNKQFSNKHDPHEIDSVWIKTQPKGNLSNNGTNSTEKYGKNHLSRFSGASEGGVSDGLDEATLNDEEIIENVDEYETDSMSNGFGNTGSSSDSLITNVIDDTANQKFVLNENSGGGNGNVNDNDDGSSDDEESTPFQYRIEDYADLEGLDETSRNNRLNLIKGQDVVTRFLQIVETQHLLGSNCTAGTALNLGEGVVDRYAQDRFRVEAEIAVNRANMLTRVFKLSAPEVLRQSEQLLHASVLSMVEFDDDIFAAGNCFDWNQHPIKKGLFCPFAYRLPYPDQDATLVKDLAAEYHYLGNTSEWFFLARKNAEKVIARNEQYTKAYHLYSNSTEREVDRILSVKYEDGRWSKPYYDCGGGNIWMLTYTVPFFGHDNGTYFFKGTSGIDIDLRRVDIDQCPQRHIPGTTQPLNIFAGTDKCKQRTTQCEPIPGLGFRRGSYKCVCRKGFYFPDTNSPQRYFNGSSLEEEYEKLMLLNEISTYNQANTYECLPCAEGCETCKDSSPCVAALNWPMRTSILVLACAVIGFLPPAAWFTFRYQQVKVLRAASPALLRVIALGAFFIYCTSIVMYPNPSIYTCTARIWLREIGFSLTYGALMLKTWRISVIFRVRSAKAVKITDASLLKRLGVLCGCIGVALLVRTIVAPPLVVVGKTADDLKAFLCKTDWWDHTFTSMEVLFLAWGVRLCIMVRKAPSEFNESRFISMAIYNEFLLTCFLNVSMLFLQSPANPDLLYIIFFCHTQLTVTLLLALIFGSKVYLVFRSGGKPTDDTIGLGGKASGAKFICRSQARTLANPSTASSSSAQLGANADYAFVTDTRLSEQEALEQIRQLCAQLQLLQERAPPRGVAIATIATLLETCSTSHPLSLKPPPAKVANKLNSYADKSTNTNTNHNDLCQQTENGCTKISISDDCDQKRVDGGEKPTNVVSVPLQNNSQVCENRGNDETTASTELAFLNLKLQCMCSEGGIKGGGDITEDRSHCDHPPKSSSCSNVGENFTCCQCRRMCTEIVPCKHTTKILSNNIVAAGGCCVNNKNNGNRNVPVSQPPPPPPPSASVNMCKNHRHSINNNKTDSKQCDGSIRGIRPKINLNNISHVHTANPMLDSSKRDANECGGGGNDCFISSNHPQNRHNTLDLVEPTMECDDNSGAVQEYHSYQQQHHQQQQQYQDPELDDDFNGPQITPSPTISNISSSIIVAEEKIIEEKILSSLSPVSLQEVEDKSSMLKDIAGETSSSSNSTTTAALDDSGNGGGMGGSGGSAESDGNDGNGNTGGGGGNGINVPKRKKQPETKLVLDLNDRSKYTKEVSV